MICCVGLLVGYFVGQSLGGVWIFGAPAIGFGLGLILDMKFMHGAHGHGAHGGGAEAHDHGAHDHPSGKDDPDEKL